MGGRYRDHGTCRLGDAIEQWVCAVLIMGVVLGAVVSSGFWAVRR
jgi:hypothetical protein